MINLHLKTLKIVSFKENSTFFIITIYLTLLDYEFNQKIIIKEINLKTQVSVLNQH